MASDFDTERRSGIGGSDIAAMLGLSRYKTPFQLWQEKTGRLDVPPSAEEMDRMYWGTVLEDVIAKRYAELTETKIQRVNGALRHPAYPYALAHIDRAVCEGSFRARWYQSRLVGAEKILEVKTAHALAASGPDWGEPGTDRVPLPYWLQCQWYLGITGVPVADLAVLFGGQRFAVYTIQADQETFLEAADMADRWWERHVLGDTPPDPHSETEARQRWPRHQDKKTAQVGADVSSAVTELAVVTSQIADLERKKKVLRDRILPAFGDAEAIECGGRTLATWKANKDSISTNWHGVVAGLADLYADDPDFLDRLGRVTESCITKKPGARVLRIAKD